MINKDELWHQLKDHVGHKVEIVCHGDPALQGTSAYITLEDYDTTILDTDDYAIIDKKELEDMIPYEDLINMFGIYVDLSADIIRPDCIRDMLRSAGVTKELSAKLDLNGYFR